MQVGRGTLTDSLLVVTVTGMVSPFGPGGSDVLQFVHFSNTQSLTLRLHALSITRLFFAKYFTFIYVFIRLPRVLIAVCRIFSCHMRT